MFIVMMIFLSLFIMMVVIYGDDITIVKVYDDDEMVMVISLSQVHEGDCYLLALDLLQQHAATLGAAAIAVTCLMVSSISFVKVVRVW